MSGGLKMADGVETNTVIRRETKYDVLADAFSSEFGTRAVMDCMVKKGFCVIKTGITKEDLTEAREDIDVLDSKDPSPFFNPPEEIVDGLLGEEGSSEIAFIDMDGGSGECPKGLKKADTILSDFADSVTPMAEPFLGFVPFCRSVGLLHSAGDADTEPTGLHPIDGQEWLSMLASQRLMFVLFLGPRGGRLELQPVRHPDAEPLVVIVEPGTLVTFRADLLSRSYSSRGKSFALSCFLLEPPSEMTELASAHPVVEDLLRWKQDLLKSIKSQEVIGKDGASWDPTYPLEWQKVVNRRYQNGQQVAIRSMAARVPNSWDAGHFGEGLVIGADLASQVPATRWNWADIYDPDPDSFKKYKLCSKHGVFMDGAELFDHKFFTLSLYEAMGIDTTQRHALEIAYEALHYAGETKKTIMRSLIGVYLGFGLFEGPLNPVPGVEAVGTTGGSASITSNRISFCLGLQGPSYTIECGLAASSLAVSQAYNSMRYQTDTYRPNRSAIFGGIYLHLAPTTSIMQSARGTISRHGRNFTFNSTADGMVKGDGGIMGVMDHAMVEVDGELVENNQKTALGIVQGACVRNMGKTASMHSISGPMDQETIHSTLRQSGLFPCDVDAVEIEGVADLIHDAVEVSALGVALRGDEAKERAGILIVGCVKTACGTMEETSGIAQLVKALQGQKHALFTPCVHLSQLNPHIEDTVEGVIIPNEPLGHKREDSIVGLTAHGMGGFSVHIIVQVPVDVGVHLPKSNAQSDIAFWPGGGGQLNADAKPDREYSIIGSWSSFEKVEAMEIEGKGVYGFTVTLGVNRYEQFQFLVDDDFERVLHPTVANAPQNAPLMGPDTSTASEALRWMIDGRSGKVMVAGARVGPSSGAAKGLQALENNKEVGSAGDVSPAGEKYYLEENTPALIGLPGSTYRVRLRIAGKWRIAEWEKLADADGAPCVDEGKYYLVGDWNEGSLADPMVPDTSSPGLFHADVKVRVNHVDFQIVRNKDFGQTFFPTRTTSDSSVPIIGPEYRNPDNVWRIQGPWGSMFRVSFQRTVRDGVETSAVWWARKEKA